MIDMIAKLGYVYNYFVLADESLTSTFTDPIEGFFKNIFQFTNYLQAQLIKLYSNALQALCGIVGDSITSQIGEYKSLFVGIGTSLAVLFIMIEILTTMVGFRFERVEEAVSLGLKFIVCKVVIENTDPIAQTIYSVFFANGFKGISKEAVDYYSKTNSIISFSTSSSTDGGILGIGFLVMAIVNLIVIFILGAFILKIIAHLVGIIFELAIHQVMAPIALSTLCNSNARSTGITWIKSYSAVCLQATIMSICFRINSFVMDKMTDVFNAVFTSTLNDEISGNLLGIAFNSVIPIFGMMLLTAALDKSGDITKRMLGA